ncbi:TPA: D-glycero-beta-D-manno-heptose 1,7-bisphosphate 7-phosphatase [Neisseria meningitidis]
MNYKIYDGAKIIKKENLSIGDYSQIDDFVFFNCGEKSILGSFVHISSFTSIIGGGEFYMDHFSGLSAGCRIITGSDDFMGGGLTNPTVPSKYTNVKKSSVRIGKHAILGTNVTVLPGVTIGDGVAVGAGAIVRKNLEPWTIYVGVDCKPLKRRSQDKILELEKHLVAEFNLDLCPIIPSPNLPQPKGNAMKLIILDRDGVINQDRDDFVKSVDEWIPVEGSMDAVAFLTQAGYTVAVATNQSGIGRKYFTVQNLTEMHAKMHRLVRQAGGEINGIWFCPHTNADNCNCRKPKPGMIEDIIGRFNAQASETWLVGDSLRDLQAIDAVGGKPALVLTGKGKKTLSQHGHELPEHTQVFDTLLDFSQYIMQENAAPQAD